MSVYFVFRSQYSTPALNYLKKYESANLLEWFRENWIPIADFDESRKHAQDLLGVDVYGFGSLFRNIAEEQLEPPQTMGDLGTLLREHLYFEGDLKFGSHVIQVVSNDDELDIAFYFFDDAFLAKNAEKAEFLLTPQWKLPCETSEGVFQPCSIPKRKLPSWNKKGTLFCALLAAYDSGDNILNIDGAWIGEGLRIPDLTKYLGSKLPGKDLEPGKEWPYEFFLLRSQLLVGVSPGSGDEERLRNSLLQNPEEEVLWDRYMFLLGERGIEDPSMYLLQCAMRECCKFPVASLNQIKNWSFENGRSIGVEQRDLLELVSGNWNNDPGQSLEQCESHVLQASIHTDRWESWNDLSIFNRWIVFDDLWANANGGLANAILSYASRWDVLD